MLGNNLLDVPLNEEGLIDSRHIAYNLLNVNGRCQCDQAFDRFPYILAEVPQKVVATKAGPNHIDRRLRIMYLYSFESSLQLTMLTGSEGDWAGHFVVDSSTVETYWLVSVIPGLSHQGLYVVHLGPSRQSVHYEQDRRVGVTLLLRAPVQRNVSSVLEEYPLPLEFVLHNWLWYVINRLQERMWQVWSGPVHSWVRTPHI